MTTRYRIVFRSQKKCLDLYANDGEDMQPSIAIVSRCDPEQNLLPLPTVAEQEKDDAGKRVTMSVQVTPETRATVMKVIDRVGVSQVKSVSRILEWFAGLEPTLQVAILTNDDDAKRELIRLALQKMAAADESDNPGVEAATLEEAAELAQRMVRKLLETSRGYARDLNRLKKKKPDA